MPTDRSPRSQPPALLTQFGVTVIVLQSVVLIGLAGFALLEVRQHDRSQARLELDRLVVAIRPVYDQALRQPHGVAHLQQMVALGGPATPIELAVIDAEGRVLAHSKETAAEIGDQRHLPEFRDATRNGFGTGERFSPTANRQMLYVARPIHDGPGAPILRAGIGDDPADVGLLRRLAGATAAAVVLAALIIIFFSHRVTTSVRRLAEGAARMAHGDLSHRVTRPSSRELAGLADALNQTAGQLSEQIVQLRAQRNEQDAILQSMSNGVIALDLDQRILSLNRAAEKMLGVSAAVARGRLLQEAIREPALHQTVSDALAGRAGKAEEFTVERDVQRRIRCVCEQLGSTDVRPAGVLAVLNDVTELRRLESMRTDFAAAVSHELRTPVTNIQGYVETLLDMDPPNGQTGAEQSADSVRFLKVIRQNSVRLAAIIEDVLSLARLEQPKAQDTLRQSPVPIGMLIGSAVDQHARAAAAKQITIVRHGEEDLVVDVHGRLIEQAIGNLLSNAINYSPPGTTVTVTSRHRGDGQVEIAVADEGQGIPEEVQPRLFERFYRVDSARSRALGGTGLGLALVKHIALVHGGHVEVQSEVGKGSVFRLTVGGVQDGPDKSPAAQ